MIDLTDTVVEKAVVHFVGNSSRGEPLSISNNLVKLDPKLQSSLIQLFFYPFLRGIEEHEFFHEIDLKHNEMYSYLQDFEEGTNNFKQFSKNTSSFLYRLTTHPNILTGDLIISAISGVKYKSNLYSAIAIVKSERKNQYIDVLRSDESITVQLKDGIDLKGLDKAAIILLGNNKKIFHYNNRRNDAIYWAKDFLGCRPSGTSENKTKAFMDACISFCKSINPENDLQNSTTNLNSEISAYIDKNEKLDYKELKKSLSINKELESAFDQHITVKEEQLKISLKDKFILDQSKRAPFRKKLEKLIKLDTNVDIKIKIDTSKPNSIIEKGFDNKKKMNYYKIYFNKEG
ncbi:nucleoid-associated protein [Teredinibacter turnerae]|uniref:nucleoid-associated protein n=1 Tax=Teredinibacter turnerae TaxID=2426 RepID=UPI0030D5D527